MKQTILNFCINIHHLDKKGCYKKFITQIDDNERLSDIEITCPHCGRKDSITVFSNESTVSLCKLCNKILIRDISTTYDWELLGFVHLDCFLEKYSKRYKNLKQKVCEKCGSFYIIENDDDFHCFVCEIKH